VRIGAPTSCSYDENFEPINCQLKYTQTENQWYWPWTAVAKGTQSLVDTMVLTVNEIRVRVGGGGGASIGGEDQPAFTGPVGIADTTGTIIEEAGWRPLIEFAALLSLNLAIFNALPIPMLDGGRMLFVVIEILRGGRRIAPEKEALVHFAGFALMMAGVIVVTYLDIARLVT
jgi:regulator of sigma E protease